MDLSMPSPPDCNLSALVAEYAAVRASPHARGDPKAPATDIAQRLVSECDWTARAAAALVHLVRDYGVFMLRNAAALAIAFDVQDGELGF
jgi:hypothetical protein